jgi:hypothetical protein
MLRVRELVQAALPEIRRLVAEGAALAKAQELTQTSNRALAKRLGLGDNGGTAAVKVGEAIRAWERVFGVRLFDVPASPDSARSERPERPERPEHITPAA